jgi:magnesium-transporting ATPase (P-type)
MKLAVFDTHTYDREALAAANARYAHDLTDQCLCHRASSSDRRGLHSGRPLPSLTESVMTAVNFRERPSERSSVRPVVKGAPERLLAMSTRLMGGTDVVPLDAETVPDAAKNMGSRGLRALGMAYRTLPDAPAGGVVPPPEELTFLGLQGMLDPPRAGVRDAIQGWQDAAGIHVVRQGATPVRSSRSRVTASMTHQP